VGHLEHVFRLLGGVLEGLSDSWKAKESSFVKMSKAWCQELFSLIDIIVFKIAKPTHPRTKLNKGFILVIIHSL
jgi:hypothetical protein